MIFSPNRRWFTVHGRPVLKLRKNGGVITLSTGHHCKNWISIETSCIVGSEGRCDIPRKTTTQSVISKRVPLFLKKKNQLLSRSSSILCSDKTGLTEVVTVQRSLGVKPFVPRSLLTSTQIIWRSTGGMRVQREDRHLLRPILAIITISGVANLVLAGIPASPVQASASSMEEPVLCPSLKTRARRPLGHIGLWLFADMGRCRAAN